ncbi:FAD-dependent monooxygenase [Pseudohalocynthiibacter aestuariivivens]|nr:NAD(P)/FAD-dependent oxidoreductase [Pseudohalocynthiibacter aestuariivivens]QIE45002.1 FAD-dependent monooxygenase [Pseudohalocynthiibacter aestuariivivens]
MSDCAAQDTIVVGAGPVGLTLALVLLRAGHSVTVLEKRGSVNLQSKASTFHASTLDLLETLNVLDPMRAKGVQVDHVQYRAPDGEVLAQLDFDLLKDVARNPFRLHYEQGDLTTVLADLFVREGGVLTFGQGVQTVRQNADGVTVTCDDGSEHAASFAFGCDGAASAVREALRIGYVEKPYPGMVLRLYANRDMRVQFPDLGGISYLHAGDDTCSLLEMPDCWRVVVRVPAGVSAAEAVMDEWITERLESLLPIKDILRDVTGRDVYSARRRGALSAGGARVFLAGDALHLTNTKGGMNLNAGLHDAFALGHAATTALRSGSSASLERAAAERARVARDVLIPRTDENIGTGLDRVKRIATLSQSPDKAAAFLAKQAMFDMLDGIPAAVIRGEVSHG